MTLEEYRKNKFKEFKSKKTTKNIIHDKTALFLEYELTQIKIDNYGKSVIQLRGVLIAAVAVLVGVFIQYKENYLLYSSLGLIIIFTYTEFENHIQQYKLKEYARELERLQLKNVKHSFRIAKVLGYPNKKYIKKVFKEIWFSFFISFIVILFFFIEIEKPKDMKTEINVICNDKNSTKVVNTNEKLLINIKEIVRDNSLLIDNVSEKIDTDCGRIKIK